MKFAHKVKHNGVTYFPGEDVPIGSEEVVKEPVKVPEDPNKTVEQQVGVSGGVKTTIVPDERKDILLGWKNRELLEELSKHGIEAKQNEKKEILVQLLLDAEAGKSKDTEEHVTETVVTEDTADEETSDSESSGFIQDVLSE